MSHRNTAGQITAQINPEHRRELKQRTSRVRRQHERRVISVAVDVEEIWMYPRQTYRWDG